MTAAQARSGDYHVADIKQADFGRDEPEFSWESTNKAAALKADARA